MRHTVAIRDVLAGFGAPVMRAARPARARSFANTSARTAVAIRSRDVLARNGAAVVGTRTFALRHRSLLTPNGLLLHRHQLLCSNCGLRHPNCSSHDKWLLE